MKDDFDYKEVPGTYFHCLHAQCPRSADCLRFLVALHADSGRALFQVVNPAFVAGKENDCVFFHRDTLSLFALGITHLLDNIPHSKAQRIQKKLFSSFGRNKFYRIRAKERLITPAEQKFIRSLFQEEGIIDEPEFDRFVYQYEWE